MNNFANIMSRLKIKTRHTKKITSQNQQKQRINRRIWTADTELNTDFKVSMLTMFKEITGKYWNTGKKLENT